MSNETGTSTVAAIGALFISLDQYLLRGSANNECISLNSFD